MNKPTDNFKLYLNSIMDKIPGDIHNELWNKLITIIRMQHHCICEYLDESCDKDCTCIQPVSSRGCKYCASYGSLEQRKNAAIKIKELLDAQSNFVVIDEVKDFWEKEEAYCDWFKCPNCNYKNITISDKFCCDCGIKLKWNKK